MRQLPPSSRLARAQVGHHYWSDSEHLLASILETLAGANWQRGGGKGQRPKPVKRPGAPGEARYGKAIPFEEARERLQRRRQGLAS